MCNKVENELYRLITQEKRNTSKLLIIIMMSAVRRLEMGIVK